MHLQVTDEEFWALTPRQFHLLLARHRERTEHRELLAGLIAATTANHSFAPPKKPLAPADFMPSQWAKKRAKPKTERMNRKRVATSVRALMSGLIAQQQKQPEPTHGQ